MARVVWAVLLMAAARSASAQAQAQEPLSHIRDLYSNAAYEDVLSALAVDDTPPPPELGQYKVFSLIALGRPADAGKAAEAVIIANPRFQPDRDASPRVLELFTSVRRRIAPDLLKSMYLNAKAAFDRKDRDAAIRGFDEVVAVADDPDLKDDKIVGELRLLASGFVELSRALTAPRPSPPGDVSGAPAVAAPSAPAPPAGVVPSPSAPKMTLAVPITETMPRWTPPDVLARREFRGSIRLRIDADGNVVSSQMVTPIHPLYDDLLLQASKRWRYQPAVTNGAAVPSERVVEVVLKPR